MRRQLAATMTAATLVLLAAACNSSSGSATPPPLTPSIVHPSTTNTLSSPRFQAEADAQAGYRRYIAAKVATATSGGVDVKPLSGVATGVILAAELRTAATYRGRKWRGVGDVEVLSTKVLKVGPAAADGRVNEVTVQACLDLSRADAVDAKGKSVRKPGTPTRLLDEMQMRFAGGAWKASYGMNKAATC